MRSERSRHRLVTAFAWGALAFLYIPLMLIVLYAFTTEDRSFVFPPPGFTLHWFYVAVNERPSLQPVPPDDGGWKLERQVHDGNSVAPTQIVDSFAVLELVVGGFVNLD